MSEVAINAVAVTDAPVTSVEMSGPQKAAALLLALGEEYGKEIWTRLDEEEVRSISVAMAQLSNMDPKAYEDILVDFVSHLSINGTMAGGVSSTEKLLRSFLPDDQVAIIMEEIRGPSGRTMWEKLSNVQPAVLANYLKNEYPQTVAVILSRIASEHSANVLTELPEEFALEVVGRMLAMESVQGDVLEKVEQTLRQEFMSNLSRSRKSDPHELMAGIFNNFDRQTEARFLTALEEENRESSERIKQLMFTFDDLGKLDTSAVQTLLRDVEKIDLAKSLKGANESLREFFFSNMSQRAVKLLKDDMEALGPMRLSDVDEAQNKLVATAKALADAGEIIVQKGENEEEMIY
ncbi:MAG: flagellar motor switch protein FliG [Hyphomicrobiales bacterium]